MAFVEKILASVKFNPADKEQVIADIKSVVEVAEAYYAGLQRDYNEKRYVEEIHKKEEELKAYVQHRYKRPTTRVRKYTELMGEFLTKTENNHEYYTESLSFIDFQFDPRGMGISENCIIHPGDGVEAYEKLYEEIKDMPYFKVCHGLSIVITTNDARGEIHSSFRPHAKLILSEELEKAYKDEEAGLAADIARFYENTTYFGD